jgi:hypothetical protein
LEARYGIRPEGRSQGFVNIYPLVLDEPYRVRDVSGAEYRLWAHDAVDGRVSLEVLPLVGPALPGDSTGVAGHYRFTAVRIGGENTDSRYPDLRLGADGVYHLGSTTGAWSTHRGAVTLSGHFGTWGPAQILPDGSLVFRFSRGELAFEIALERAAEAPSKDSRTPGS